MVGWGWRGRKYRVVRSGECGGGKVEGGGGAWVLGEEVGRAWVLGEVGQM